MGLPLVTKAEYKAYQGITSTTSDALIDALIPKVSELVKNTCRRTFVDYVDDAKIQYSEGGTDSISLDEFPIIAVSSVEYSTDYGNTYTTLTEFTNYAVSKATDSLRPILMTTPPPEVYGYTPYGTKTNPIFPYAINGYKITYNAGYEVLPEDLKLAVLDIIAYYVKNDSAVHTHVSGNPNTMQVEYIKNTQFPAHIRRILELYSANYN
jgi:hypothetical protein